jgi:hypothetical protein
MTTPRTLTAAVALIALLTGCSAEDTMPGEWTASDGGTLVLNEDGTGWTDAAYFVGKPCMNDGDVITEMGIEWRIHEDPDVVADNFNWLPDADALARIEAELGCTIGEGEYEEPILSVSPNEVEFGYDALTLSQVFQTLTRR